MKTLFQGIDKKKYPPLTYDYAQEEIAAKAGINMDQVRIQFGLEFLFKDIRLW